MPSRDEFTVGGYIFYYGQEALDTETGLTGHLSFSPMGHKPTLIMYVDGTSQCLRPNPDMVEVITQTDLT